MAIHQCPRCELRFASTSEVEWHLLEDHWSRLAIPHSSVATPGPMPSPTARGARRVVLKGLTDERRGDSEHH